MLRSALETATELRRIDDTLVLVASDQRLLRAASNEGLLTFNPETDTEEMLKAWLDIP